MSLQATISAVKSQAIHTASAHLLLASPSAILPDAEITDHNGGSQLIFRGQTHRISLTFVNVPLGAEHFIGAIGAFVPASERAAMMGVIGHHEAHIALELTLDSTASASAHAPGLLRQVISALSPLLRPLALLWGPTHRLHHGAGMAEALTCESPLRLFLAPVFKSVGPRRLATLHFTGARACLGFGLGLHLINLDRDAATEAGLAFAQACQSDPTLRFAQSFHHKTQSFRLSHATGPAHVTLIPLPNQQYQAALVSQATARLAGYAPPSPAGFPGASQTGCL